MERVNILRQQIDKLSELLMLLQDENLILIKGTVEEINQITKEKAEMLQGLLLIEEKRIQLLGDLTLKGYEVECEEELSDLIENYQRLIPKILELIEQNRLLCEMGYHHNTQMIEIITSSVKEKITTYGKSGKMKQGDIKPAAILNRKA